MRVKEWSGWHFPEMARLVNDNVHYANSYEKFAIGPTSKFARDSHGNPRRRRDGRADVVGHGGDVHGHGGRSERHGPCGRAGGSSGSYQAYRAETSGFTLARMQALAPNLTTLVGSWSARALVQHAGSIMNLAKQPASTVQILGAEKALFRALKTKHDTPKYGLIYHASLIGQAAPKNKGKIARVLARNVAGGARRCPR